MTFSEDITFRNGDLKLTGTLSRPETRERCPAMVILHAANGGDRSFPFYSHLLAELPRRGIAVFLYDRRGSGESEGDFERADFAELADDAVAAMKVLQTRSNIDPQRLGLYGVSQGAWITPIAAVKQPETAFVVAVSASGVSPADQMDYGVARHLQTNGFGPAQIQLAIELRKSINEYFRGHLSREEVAAQLRPFEAEPWFESAYLYPSAELPGDVRQSKWHYEMDHEPLAIWEQVTQPSLFLFADRDEWVPTEQSMENYRAATRHLPDVTLIRIKGTDHLMYEDAAQTRISAVYLNTLLDWLEQRLES